jgi:hypothetical protein
MQAQVVEQLKKDLHASEQLVEVERSKTESERVKQLEEACH